VQYGYDEPESKEAEDALQEAEKQVLKANRKKDNKAKTIIYQGLDEAIFEIIASAETSKEIWKALQQKYKGANRIKKIRLQSLRGEFELFQMKSSESISDYHTRIMVIVNQMRRNGEALTDARITEKILRSLDPKFDFVVVAIEESKEVDKLMVDELMSSLQAHEQKIVKRNGDKAIEHALQALSLKDRYEQGETSTSRYTT
jgi:RNase H-fold protein (predicted Holliday junction resolvase)